ncbi:putative glycosyltransferase [Frankia canadensis]|uniref:Putative glycosyltransferase n=1 Tax=Frankia canadensis TaxID=1836972 RepID=A0A2I2L126_9ACTN|nr:glycosyltransferase [Frankia canadensis]SNQ51610.1 putative glycosyltransferase [Frankia canadensis]SOU58900.1 putative glycosyltransferase [Frankia canadensis]
MPDEEPKRSTWQYELVLVSYHSREQLEGLFATLPVDMPVVVVDNASGVDRVDELLADRPNSRYLDSGGGKGFAKAANMGIRSSRYEFIVLGNPDSRPTVEVIDILVDDLLADQELVTSAATMKGHDGRPELGNGGWEPTPRRVLLHVLGAHKVAPNSALFARPVPGRPMSPEWLTGACMAVRRSTFLELGAFDETFFVYNEDMALGRAIREAGLRQKLHTDLLVPHGAGGSGAGKTWMLQMRGASMVRYLRKHNAPSRVNVMRSMLVAGYAGRTVLSRARGQKATADEHAAYIKGLLTGPPAP